MSTEDRRAPGTSRIPFDGLVEVGGAMGPSFEAQAVNISEDGMLLRTAYLPEEGQPLTCRFDAGPGESVLASGEVVWSQGAEKGGEFAIRFTEMDSQSVEALKRACGIGEEPAAAPAPAGTKVRLHIEGLASPMRAKIKDSQTSEITVGSDLGFLQVGKHLELEDAQSGGKRPACIDRVEVAVDPSSQVPQLVVTLRYDDVEQAARAPRPAAPSIAPKETPAASKAAEDEADAMEASIKMKGTLAHGIARIGPAMEKLANRAKTTIALLAARRTLRGDEASMPKRTTAPAPGGGLHAAGRRVVRGEQASVTDEAKPANKMKLTRRKVAVGSAVMVAAIIGALALKKGHHDDAATAAAAASAQTPHTPPTAVAADTAPAMPFPPPIPAPTSAPLENAEVQGSSGGLSGGLTQGDDDTESAVKGGHKHHGKLAPFGNGPVHHGNVLHLKMDGPIEAIEGAQQPTGFAVKIPGRKSLEAAGPLAARDSRIAAIKVSNDPAGAELTIAFKDGVPNYRVDGKGDTLVISLAAAGSLDKTVAKNDPKGAKGAKHAHHDHKKAEKH